MNTTPCPRCGIPLPTEPEDGQSSAFWEVGDCPNCQQLTVDRMHELLFEQECENGEHGSDSHFIACGECSEPVDCCRGIGTCSFCGRIHIYVDAEQVWKPTIARVAV